eukprot:4036157-Prymnesium_polylepis.1
MRHAPLLPAGAADAARRTRARRGTGRRIHEIQAHRPDIDHPRSRPVRPRFGPALGGGGPRNSAFSITRALYAYYYPPK